MALIAKPLPVSASQGVANTRPVIAPRGGSASSHAGPVEATNPISGASYGDGTFSGIVSQEEGDFSGHSFNSFTPGHQRDHNDELPHPHTGVIQFTSQGFAELLEMRDTVTGGSSDTEGNNRGRALGRGLDYASALYEAVINIADGNGNIRGETVSMTL